MPTAVFTVLEGSNFLGAPSFPLGLRFHHRNTPVSTNPIKPITNHGIDQLVHPSEIVAFMKGDADGNGFGDEAIITEPQIGQDVPIVLIEMYGDLIFR